MENETSRLPLGDLPVMKLIREKYLPATLETATVRMTTVEITEQVVQHTGMDIHPSIIARWLEENGYTCDAVGDMRFEWLMKEAE